MTIKRTGAVDIQAVKTLFRTLRYRNFRLFFFGQSISLIGTWMQIIAMSWLAYRMTNSPVVLGLVAFAGQIPTFILSPFAGLAADRFNRHKMLVITQALLMAQASILAVLTISGTIAVWHIVVLELFLGVVNSFDIPIRQVFIMEMVEKKDNLGNAIALNSFMFNAARLVGPSLAGGIIAFAGEGACFLVNALSFVAVIISLLMMRMKKIRMAGAKRPVMKELSEGFAYTFGSVPIRSIILLLAAISLMGASYMVLVPIFAKDILHGGADTYGLLMAAAGAGALAATTYLASRKSIVGLGDIIPACASIFAAGLLLFSFSRTLWLSLILMGVAGFGFMAHMAASNTIIQTISDDDKRGRVMSFFTMAFMGTAPIGSLMAGFLAHRIGAANTIIFGASLCVVAAVIFSTKLPHIRKILLDEHLISVIKC